MLGDARGSPRRSLPETAGNVRGTRPRQSQRRRFPARPRRLKMQSLPREDVPVAIADGALEVRVKTVEGLMVGFVRLPAGADLRPATKGLPDDLCPCPHW